MLTFSVDHDLVNKSNGILLLKRINIKKLSPTRNLGNLSVAKLSIPVHFHKKVWIA